mmetsp:Transcript_4971/g.10177  ORF Transcript_4971/g.10177 Transcript_4971/m.10177 type:complete len:272 (-) Transcript_4971:2923-3738(-)
MSPSSSMSQRITAPALVAPPLEVKKCELATYSDPVSGSDTRSFGLKSSGKASGSVMTMKGRTTSRHSRSLSVSLSLSLSESAPAGPGRLPRSISRCPASAVKRTEAIMRSVGTTLPPASSPRPASLTHSTWSNWNSSCASPWIWWSWNSVVPMSGSWSRVSVSNWQIFPVPPTKSVVFTTAMPRAPWQNPKSSWRRAPCGVTTDMKPASGPCCCSDPLWMKYWSCTGSYTIESGARTNCGLVTSTTTSGAPSSRATKELKSTPRSTLRSRV